MRVNIPGELFLRLVIITFRFFVHFLEKSQVLAGFVSTVFSDEFFQMSKKSSGSLGCNHPVLHFDADGNQVGAFVNADVNAAGKRLDYAGLLLCKLEGIERERIRIILLPAGTQGRNRLERQAKDHVPPRLADTGAQIAVESGVTFLGIDLGTKQFYHKLRRGDDIGINSWEKRLCVVQHIVGNPRHCCQRSDAALSVGEFRRNL